MHKGRQYPFLNEYWLVETQFWPRFVPRKFQMLCTAGFGTLWDALHNAGDIVSNVGTENLPFAGDARYQWDVDADHAAYLFIEKQTGSPKFYRGTLDVVQFSTAESASAHCDLDFNSSTWFQVFEIDTFNPPFSLHGPMFCPITPALWFQV